MRRDASSQDTRRWLLRGHGGRRLQVLRDWRLRAMQREIWDVLPSLGAKLLRQKLMWSLTGFVDAPTQFYNCAGSTEATDV